MAILQVANVLLLLASLFSLPALHAVDFQYCNEIFSTDGDIGYKYGNISRVEIYPNPVGPQDDLAFWILGSSNSESSRIEIGLVSVRDADGPLRLYTFEETGVGPAGSTIIEPGTTFALTLLKVPHRRPEMISRLYVVLIVDATRERYGDYKEAICVAFYVPTSAPTSASA